MLPAALKRFVNEVILQNRPILTIKKTHHPWRIDLLRPLTWFHRVPLALQKLPHPPYLPGLTANRLSSHVQPYKSTPTF